MALNNSYFRFLKILKENQSPARFRHSLSVSRLSGELAEKYGWDVEKARLAGLLHDWAKEWPPKKLMGYVKKHHLTVPDLDFIAKTSPNLLHAYVGAHDLKRLGWIKDQEILKAISSHTLGALKMGVPEKIVFIADFSSYDRRYSKAEEVRKQAFRDMEKGFLLALETKIRLHLMKRKAVHPLVIRVWNAGISHG